MINFHFYCNVSAGFPDFYISLFVAIIIGGIIWGDSGMILWVWQELSLKVKKTVIFMPFSFQNQNKRKKLLQRLIPGNKYCNSLI